MSEVQQIEVTHEHLDDAIIAQRRGGGVDNTSCILAQLANDVWGGNGGAGNSSVCAPGCKESMRFKETHIATQLSELNDDYEWGKLNDLLPLTLSYVVEQSNAM
tara:strand:- start:148 stop:459 length:312 start_codon:yes stop_codon:yes gene_type:complete